MTRESPETFRFKAGVFVFKLSPEEVARHLEEGSKNGCPLCEFMKNKLLCVYAQLDEPTRQAFGEYIAKFGTTKNKRELARRGRKSKRT